MKDYIFKNFTSLLFKLILLIGPIILGGWFILTQYNTFDYFNDLSKYNINSVFILFVYIALIPVLVNIVYYLNDSFELVFKYIGNNKAIKRLNKFSFFSILLIAIVTAIFILLISIKYLSFHQIVEYNRYVSLAIFLTFLVIDILTWKSELIEKKENNGDSEHFDINISFSKESTFLINLPTLLIISLSLIFTYQLEHIEFYKNIIDRSSFLFDIQILVDKEIIELFINGIETGILMTSIVFSQIIFFFIKTKWDYRIFKNTNNGKENE